MPPATLHRPLGSAVRTLVAALAYAAAAWLTYLLHGRPLVCAVFPPAGLALAAVLAWGRPALWGVLLGALAFQLSLLFPAKGFAPWHALAGPVLSACAAAAAAWVGWQLVQRKVGLALLDAPPDILRFLLWGGVVATSVNGAVGGFGLWLSGAAEARDAASWGLQWWVGDTLGVAIGAPLVLAFIGEPAADWRPRRRTLALPLLVALVLLGAAQSQFQRLETARRQANFERDVNLLSTEALGRLQAALHALQALRNGWPEGKAPDAAAVRGAARWWLQQTSLNIQAMGYVQRVREDGLEAFEAQARKEGEAAYLVFDRDQGAARAGDAEVVALRQIEPRAGNAPAMGVNVLSIPAARAALLASRDSGSPRATAGFALTQDRSQTGLVLYQALFDGEPADTDARRSAFRGAAFVTLRTEALFGSLGSGRLQQLQWCLFDPDPSVSRPRLAGQGPCPTAHAAPGESAFHALRMLDIGGRPVELRVALDPGLAVSQPGTALLMALALVSVTMLATLLLTVTGQTRRTERAVRASTAFLRHEMQERNQTAQALRDSEARLRGILEHAPLGIVFTDPRGVVLEANTRLQGLLGQEGRDLAGVGVLSLVPPEAAPGLMELRHQLLREQREQVVTLIELPAGTQGSGRRLVRITASAVRDASGRVQRIISLFEDVTDVQRLESAERARAQAEAANRAKGEVLSRISHELRTPLNAMIGFAQLMDMDRLAPLPDAHRERSRQIQVAGWQLIGLIDETLDLARLESGQVQVQVTALNTAQQVQAAWDLVQGDQDHAGQSARLQVDIGPGAQGLRADPQRLRQVLTNLLSNAVKYGRSGSAITVQAQAERDAEGHDWVLLSVRDEGLGMDAEQLANLFQPYNRLGREHSGIRGTGIGLVISRNLAELMGGSLSVTSAPGAGSVFTLRLPAAAPGNTPVPADLRRVLYVEDNATNAEVMRGLFTLRPQWTLLVAETGSEGVATALRERPDLLLLDLNLPDFDGLEVLRRIRQEAGLRDIPAVMVSADATPALRQAAHEAGAVDYVTKPVSIGPLLALLDRLMPGSSPAHSFQDTD